MACCTLDELLFDWTPSGRAFTVIAAPSSMQPTPLSQSQSLPVACIAVIILDKTLRLKVGVVVSTQYSC